MDLILYGTSYKSAPLEIRESFSLSKEEVPALLTRFLRLKGIYEIAALSTCNRTEIYTVLGDDVGADGVKCAFHEFKRCEAPQNPPNNGYFYCLKNIDVVRHLFRVSASLESQVLGENQIQGQVKEAYFLACRAGANGSYLNKLFHMAFKVGKRVRSETDLGSGATSVSSAAVELAYNNYKKLDGKGALLIGAGETAELVARHLVKRGISSLKIANRTRAKGEELARTYNGEIVDFGRLAEEFFKSDIVISATGSPGYILESSMLRPHIVGRGVKKVMVIDIAIPRDIDPEIKKFGDIILYDMDDLKDIVGKNIEVRQREIPRAEAIVAEAVADYERWLKEKRVVPTIKFLKERFEGIRLSELEKNKECRDCSKREEMDYLTRRIINKILRAPIT